MGTVSEASHLLSNSSPRENNRSCCTFHVKYRLPKTTEKGAILVIVCNVLILIAVYAQLRDNNLATSSYAAFVVMSIIAFPIAGIVADTHVGRFKIIQTGIALLIASSLFNIILFLLKDSLPSTVETVFVVITEVICCIGISCYIACSLPFTADQMIGASAEQLTFAVYWAIWGFAICNYTYVLKYIPKESYLATVLKVASFLCVSSVAFIIWYWKDSLMTVPQLTNPYKLTFRVLNYATKHKYPERRSALTYWEEQCPSRIDLGKSKYGGPFTVEEVENVKTLLRLVPVVLCSGGYNVTAFIWADLSIAEHFFLNDDAILACLDIFQLMVAVLSIPVYHFLIYPFFYNYIPTMLKRIGFGLFLLFCSFAMFAILGDILLCSSHTNVTCYFFHSEIFNVSSNGLWWFLFPITAYNLGYLVSITVLFEFVFAQTPHLIRGLMTALAILSGVLSGFIGYGICQLITIISPISHSWFYSYVSIIVANFVQFVLFVCFSKQYKLRKRDDIVPFHMFAEEFFEKELEGQRRLEKQRSQWEERITITN